MDVAKIREKAEWTIQQTVFPPSVLSKELASYVLTLLARVAKLEAALNPFAEAVILPGAPSDGYLSGWLDEYPDALKVSDCQIAHELLAKHST